MWKIGLIALAFIMSCNSRNQLTVSITPVESGVVMDPSTVYFLNEYYLIENMSLRLVEMDAKHGYKLMLASSIETEDGLQYKIKIKATNFSNGERVTLEDVQHSFLRAMGNKNSHVNLKEIVKSIKIEGDSLLIVLHKKTNDFFYYLTLIDLSILHKSQYIKDTLLADDWVKVTSGPFSYLIEEGAIYLLKNRHYKLSRPDYPDKVLLTSARGRDSFLDFVDGKIDVGEFNLNSYDKHISELHKIKNLRVIGNSGDMVNFLALNVESKKFSSEYNRKWILKKILLNFEVPSQYQQVARKAYEFFTPQVKGFLSEDKIKNEVHSWDHIDISTIPADLKSGLVIKTYQRAFEVTLESVLKGLEKILGVPVRIDAEVRSPDFESFITKRDWEIFLGITSMDQVIVGESINLYYFSSFPMFKDVNGKMQELMKKYRFSEPTTVISTVNEMALQMIRDAECIPLFYVASPFFFDSEKLDVNDLDELTYFNLWKLKFR